MADPCISEDRIDEIDQEVHKQSGWFKAAAGFATVLVLIAGGFNSLILTKLSNIEALLTDSRLVQSRQVEQIETLKHRVDKLEDYHKWNGDSK